MTYVTQEREYLKKLQAIPDEVRGAARVVPCMPGTRRDILDTVTAWLQNPDAPQNILWVSGSPGAGKSAIAASVVDMLKAQGELGSFYVFKQGNAIWLILWLFGGPLCMILWIYHFPPNMNIFMLSSGGGFSLSCKGAHLMQGAEMWRLSLKHSLKGL
ncbi:hypothetical protein BD779DRAFT_224301 [Infundibulicybe gibba]|nr:hypothetical protein BD779DRAFT_224301 [Infundibulicybe gibba]